MTFSIISIEKNIDVNPGNELGIFQGVDFYYPTRPDVQVLKHINLEIEPGEKIALVGSSGAGKSTIASLLLQFYKPTHGTILFDDKEAETYDLSSLRNEITIGWSRG